MSFKRKAFYYLLIFVLAVAAQGVMHCRSIQPPRTDAVGYDTLATNLVLGNGYTVDRTHPAVFRGPLYPAFLSVVYRIFGLNNYTAAAAVHLLLIAFSCLLMIVIGEQLGSFRTGVAAAALMAICPTVGDYIPFMLTETFYTFITMGLCLSLVVWTRRQTPAFAALAGGIIGISLLCRLTLQFYAVAAALYLGVFVLKRKKLLQVALFLCMLPAVLFPWTLRNWRAFSTFIPVEKGTLGPVLWLSSLPVEGIHNGSWQTEPLGTLRQQMRDIELDNYFKQRAMRIIRQHPFVYLRVVLGRVPGLWLNADYYAFMGISGKLGNDLIEKKYMIVAAKIALKLLEAAVMLCALWGIVPAYRRYGHAAGILLLLLFYYNIHAFLEGVPRYVCPVYPLVLLFAVIGFSDLWSRRKISAGVKAA